jgi:NAD(P)-dependent dehydrogenase (short-subunit alcohol dehydrogenase family)
MNHQRSRKVVVVTGASAGVGRAAVRAFARKGADVGLIARGHDGLEAAKREVEACGGRAVVSVADVADPDAVERAATEIERSLGPIDIWVNNAMASVFSRFIDMTPDEFRRVTEVTYLGYVHGTWAALRRMQPRNRGVIVQVGSALAYRGIPLQSAYCGSKHAIQGFTESLRCELFHDKINIHLTMVQLGAMNTPQFRWVKSRLPRKAQPVPPIYQPEVAADAIVWAAHHRRREVYVGGMTTAVIVGNKIAPYLGDMYLGKTGFDSQMTDEPADPSRPNNLWEPVAGDHGAHGVFDRRSCDHSVQLWMTKNRRWLGALGGLAALAGVAIARAAGGADNKRREAPRRRLSERHWADEHWEPVAAQNGSPRRVC